MFASEFNRLYYNPNVNYEPPVDGAGNQATVAFPNGACAGVHDGLRDTYRTMTAPTRHAWTAAARHVPDPPASCRRRDWPPTNIRPNLTIKCTPACSATPTGPAAPRRCAAINTAATLAPRSATPTARIRPAAGGADCRINGTAYDALDGAPAVVDDYNYPYNKSAGGNNPKLFLPQRWQPRDLCKTSAPVGRNHAGRTGKTVIPTATVCP